MTRYILLSGAVVAGFVLGAAAQAQSGSAEVTPAPAQQPQNQIGDEKRGSAVRQPAPLSHVGPNFRAARPSSHLGPGFRLTPQQQRKALGIRR
ncbi:MAG: hypothetical protein AAFQ58_10170 [Pseudomonadota bacterium]